MSLVPIEKAIHQGNRCPICGKFHSGPSKISARHVAEARQQGITAYDYTREEWHREPFEGVEQTFIVCAKVAPQDAELLDRVPDLIRDRFAKTAIRIIECEPQQTRE